VEVSVFELRNSGPQWFSPGGSEAIAEAIRYVEYKIT
jgi:hypothetical protein